MKIYAFDVREDELEYFDYLKTKHNLDITLSKHSLTKQQISTVEAGSGVSVLGLYTYDREALTLLQQQGVNHLSVRAIGTNNIDLVAAKELGIHVCNAAYPPNGVADYTIMMILLCLRNYKQALWRTQVNDYSLTGLLGREICTLTIGVIGTGRIGQAVIKSLSGFGCRILAYDTQKSPEVEPYAQYVTAEEIYAQSDVITLHMPLLPSTKHIINDSSIKQMKSGVILINCARGGLMDTNSLIEHIESEHIGALGLDCIEFEEHIVHKNLKTDIFSNREMAYLRQFKNVVHTQHMAFYTRTAVESMIDCGVFGLIKMQNNQHCPTQII